MCIMERSKLGACSRARFKRENYHLAKTLHIVVGSPGQ